MQFNLSIYLVIAHALLSSVAGSMDMLDVTDEVNISAASSIADDKQANFSEYVLKLVASYNNTQDAQDAPVDHLVMNLNKDLIRLVEGAAEKLGKPSSEVYEGVSALIRARGGGGRGPRHHFNPRDFLDSIYNEESRKFVDRMYELFKQMVSAYVKSVSESGLDESPHTSMTASSQLYPAPMPSTSETSPAKENDDTALEPSTITSQKKSHNTSSTGNSKSMSKTKSKSQSDRDEDDDDDDEDDDDNADTDDEGNEKNNGKDRQIAGNSDQSASSTTPTQVPIESLSASTTSTDSSTVATTVVKATATPS